MRLLRSMPNRLDRRARGALLRVLNAMHRLLLVGLIVWLGLAGLFDWNATIDLRLFALLCVLMIVINAIRRLLL